MDRNQNPIRRRRGTALLQTALCFPILLYIIFGTFEFGEYFYVKHAFTGAAVAGAQTAIVSGQSYSVLQTNVADCLSSIPSQNYSITVKDNGTTLNNTLAGITPGDNVTVTISGTWSQLGWGFSAFRFITGTKVVSGTSVMRAEMAQ